MENEKRLDKIRDVLNSLSNSEENGVYILTGSNGSGKSLIRKQLPFNVASAKGYNSPKGLVHSVSMEFRTALSPESGALNAFKMDLEWLPASLCTLTNIENLLRSKSEKLEWFVIDEPEIGMGEEMQLALVHYLNTILQSISRKVLIISHSRIIVENLNEIAFFNLDDYNTKEEWLNRVVVAGDIKQLRENNLFKYINDLQKNGES